mmetsp:Transcript_11985/g.33718  ORF Transcript_11985/g.33718 Transcript_11985/m.33718 type:complete len:541 (+) Transcript_11985:33-1655(+)|eukprot:CAMPEP_0117653720 /NCGR_PEP_ID=MMETSP0804-20121206/3350_1 /TAXON_ID=1074897 /ORGANISM="Tetraselmis astigmatica, Strain CCMP880" /LENGTH=540 /DNA_ID=CAMNT_0005459931 /DNA_START=21 /DNA_END=1643 /DNA_ORIENTATION=+
MAEPEKSGGGDADGKGRNGCSACSGAVFSYISSRPWKQTDNYVIALQSVVGIDILFITAWAIYRPLVAVQGVSAASTVVIIGIIACKNVLVLSKPLLGEASKKSVINVTGTVVAGLITLLLLLGSGVALLWGFLYLVLAVFSAFYLVELASWSYDFPMLFCSTLVTNMLMSLSARTLQRGVVMLTNSTIGMTYAVLVVLALVVFLFPRTGSINALSTIKSVLEETAALNKYTWSLARFHRQSGLQYSLPDENTKNLTNEDLLQNVEKSLSKVIIKAGKLDELLKISENEGLLNCGRLGCLNLTFFLPCWPCHLLGPKLPTDEIKRLATALHTTAILLREAAHFLAVLSQMDIEEVEHLHAFYHPEEGDDRQYLGEIAASMSGIFQDLADCFPLGMVPVSRLSSGKHLQELQAVLKAVKVQVRASAERIISEMEASKTVGSQQEAAPAKKPHSFLERAHRQQPVPQKADQPLLLWQPGLEGFGNACRYAGFQRLLEQLVVVMADVHTLTNAVLQRLPWTKLEEESTPPPPPAAADAPVKVN